MNYTSNKNTTPQNILSTPWFSFSGRLRRRTFCCRFLILTVFMVSFKFLTELAIPKDGKMSDVPIPIALIMSIYGLIILLSLYSHIIRRYHDSGRSMLDFIAICFLSCIPVIGGIVAFYGFIVAFCFGSTIGPNKYGPNPKGINPNNGYTDSYSNQNYSTSNNSSSSTINININIK